MRDLREIKNELKNSTSGSKDKPSKLDSLYQDPYIVFINTS